MRHWRTLQVKTDTVIDDEKIILSYNGTNLFTSNNLSIINGPKGSMKSTARDFLLDNLLSPQEGFASNLERGVVIIDTEMSKRLIQRNLRLRFGDKVDVFSLKGESQHTLVATTEAIIDELRPEILVIDGTRDFLINSNDPSESMRLINQLMYWVDAYKLHIVNIVHSVKTDNGTKTKGTFGSELENKAETILSMMRYRDTATIKCTASRETQPFDNIKITINKDGRPVRV